MLEGIRSKEPIRVRVLGWVYARAGRVEEARAVLAELDELSRDAYVAPDCFAMVYAGLGDNDQAFDWLEKALAERSPHLNYLKFHPEWEPLRDDPRWADLISRISYFAEE